jgi:hypothetical protein
MEELLLLLWLSSGRRKMHDVEPSWTRKWILLWRDLGGKGTKCIQL